MVFIYILELENKKYYVGKILNYTFTHLKRRLLNMQIIYNF